MNKSQFLSKKDLTLSKKAVRTIVSKLDLKDLISLKEVEEELGTVEQIHESPLLMGIVMRCMEDSKEGLIEDFIPAITAWKNFIPHEDLGGLSPFEYEQKYQRGENEVRIMTELMYSYQNRLGSISKEKRESLDIDKDFEKFQKEFLSLMPNVQPFTETGRALNNREIIIEERRRLGHPPEKLKEVHLKIFADNIAARIASETEQIEEDYISDIKQLSKMQENTTKIDIKGNFKKARIIFKNLIYIEPYMKCLSDSHKFYLNFANVAFMCGLEDHALGLIKKSLSLKPDYNLAKESFRRIKGFLAS